MAINPTVITPVMMAPSIPQSSNALFPLPQPSPVQALVNYLDAAKFADSEVVDLMDRLSLAEPADSSAFA